MRLYKHKDYNEYVNIQTNVNKGKIKLVWVKGKEIDSIVNHIKGNIKDPKFGICHGVRNAYEVEQFRKKLNINVIGTEISDTAGKFDNTIQWDFHNIKDEWVDGVDFIYSNSFDHSYDPSMCLDKWMSCTKKDGVCYIHWGHDNTTIKGYNASDCFSASEKECRKMFNKKYIIVDEICSIPSRIIFAIKHKD